MKLADEIRGMITGFPKPLDADRAPYSEGFITATTNAAKLVEKREVERAERIKTFSNEYDAIRWGHDGDCGANEVVSRFLESEDVYNAEVSAGLAEATQANYERAAAEMHEELVEAAVYLASAVGKNFVPDRILAIIKRAKAL